MRKFSKLVALAMAIVMVAALALTGCNKPDGALAAALVRNLCGRHADLVGG